MQINRQGLSSDVDSAVLSVSHISHFNIPRTAVTLKQLLNCVFLFTIYAPHSPAPLLKLRLTQMRIREFSQPEDIPSGTEALTSCEVKILFVFANQKLNALTHTIYAHIYTYRHTRNICMVTEMVCLGL